MNDDFLKAIAAGALGIATNLFTLGVSLSDVKEWLQIVSLAGGLVVTALTIVVLWKRLCGNPRDDR